MRSNHKSQIANRKQSGITLLLVVVILSALLSVGIGIFNVLFGQLQISGDLADSFIAFYRADQAIERILYLDRSISPSPINNGYCEDTIATSACAVKISGTPVDNPNGCYRIKVTKAASPPGCGGSSSNTTCIVSVGQYRCVGSRISKRGFSVNY